MSRQAISNAREHDTPAMRCTLAMRSFNCALWHLREGRVERACAYLKQTSPGDAKTLAAIAATCTRSIGAAELEAKEEARLHAIVRDMCGRIVTANGVADWGNGNGPADSALDATALANLCVAVADVGGLAPHTAPAAWAAWALQHVPHAKPDTLSRLVLHCKAGAEPSVQEYYDAVVKAAPARSNMLSWCPAASRPLEAPSRSRMAL